jgi:hypothetical protein
MGRMAYWHWATHARPGSQAEGQDGACFPCEGGQRDGDPTVLAIAGGVATGTTAHMEEGTQRGGGMGMVDDLTQRRQRSEL